MGSACAYRLCLPSAGTKNDGLDIWSKVKFRKCHRPNANAHPQTSTDHRPRSHPGRCTPELKPKANATRTNNNNNNPGETLTHNRVHGGTIHNIDALKRVTTRQQKLAGIADSADGAAVANQLGQRHGVRPGCWRQTKHRRDPCDGVAGPRADPKKTKKNNNKNTPPATTPKEGGMPGGRVWP